MSIQDFPFDEPELDFEAPDYCEDRLSGISMLIPSIRERCKILIPHRFVEASTTDVKSLMADAQDLIVRLDAWYLCVPESWNPVLENFKWDETDDMESAKAWSGLVHAYPSLQIASLFNDYRTFKIYLQATIIRCLLWLVPSIDLWQESPACGTLERSFEHLVDGICASVPFLLGDSTIQDSEQIHSNGAGGFLLLWPLFIAGSLESSSLSKRKWIRNRLRYIAATLGFKQADVLADEQRSLITKERMQFE